MQKRVTLSGLIDAAAMIAGAAFIAFLVHFTWIAVLFVFLSMVVLVCVFAGIAPNAKVALEILNLLLSAFYIDIGVCGSVFAFAMFWGVVFSAGENIGELRSQRGGDDVH